MNTHLILTVGTGTAGKFSNLAQGLINTILKTRPAAFWLVSSTSPDSIGVADLILEQLPGEVRDHFRPWEAGESYLKIENHDSLEETRTKVAELLRHVRTADSDAWIIVNPTSGTKQMSAGATVAALDLAVDRIEFTTGKRADGVVITDTEIITPFEAGRWRAETDTALAADLWNRRLPLAAAEVLRAAAKHLPTGDAFRSRLLALALVSDALAHKETFQFGRAVDAFKNARRDLQADALPRDTPLYRLSRDCDDSRKRMERLARAQGGERKIELQRELLAELIENSMHCAASGRFEDASCRLYRAIEMNLQIRLAEKTDGTYWNGCLSKGREAPAALTSSGFLTTIRRAELPHELSMEHLARALDTLGDETVRPLCEDLDRNIKSEFRAATSSRNASILAHGTTPVTSGDFRQLQEVATKFLGISTHQNHKPLLFDSSWLTLQAGTNGPRCAVEMKK